MTAGKGVVHGEMFPLVHKDKPNPTKFFQIWINLPKVSKMVEPAFNMVRHGLLLFMSQLSHQFNVVHMLHHGTALGTRYSPLHF